MTGVQAHIHAAYAAPSKVCICLSKQEAESRSAAAPSQEFAPADSAGASGIADQELAAGEQHEAQHSSRTDELHADSTSSQKPLA